MIGVLIRMGWRYEEIHNFYVTDGLECRPWSVEDHSHLGNEVEDHSGLWSGLELMKKLRLRPLIHYCLNLALSLTAAMQKAP